MTQLRPSSFGLPDGWPKLAGPSLGAFFIYLQSILSCAFSIQLILFFCFFIAIKTILIISPYASVAGHSLLETCLSFLSSCQSRKKIENMQEGGDFRGREQQEREDKTKGTPAVSKLIKWSQSGRSKVLERLCNFATLCAFVQSPTVVAAYGVQIDDAMTGYGVISASVILLMATVLVLEVGDSVQWHWKSFRDSVRGPLKKLSYMVWVALVLVAIPIILTSVFNDVNLFEAADSITPEMWVWSRVFDLKYTRSLCYRSCLGIAVLFAAARRPYMFGTCRRCGGTTPCGCSPYGGGEGCVRFCSMIKHESWQSYSGTGRK